MSKMWDSEGEHPLARGRVAQRSLRVSDVIEFLRAVEGTQDPHARSGEVEYEHTPRAMYACASALVNASRVTGVRLTQAGQEWLAWAASATPDQLSEELDWR